MIGYQKKGYGAYISRKDRLRKTATGKSRPSDTPARRADSKVSLGEDVDVEKKSRCFWNAEYLDRDMIIKGRFIRRDRAESKMWYEYISSLER
jgi:hypothetical protein